MDLDWLIAAILACADEAAMQVLCDTLVTQYSGDELEALADQLKLKSFDRLLHSDPAAARQMALFIQVLGKMAQRPGIGALGLLALGDATRQQGQAAAAIALFEQAADMYEGAGDRVGWARARSGWLAAATNAGRITLADLAHMDEVCQVFQDARQSYRLAMVEQDIGLVYQSLARYTQAVALFERALGQLGSSSNAAPHETNLRAMLLGNKANALLWQGDLDQARAGYSEARALFVRIGNMGLVAVADMNLSVIERLRGQVHAALLQVRSAIDGLRRVNQRVSLALALVYHADLLLMLNRREEAAPVIAEAVASFRQDQIPDDLADALYLQARVHLRAGDEQAALECLLEGEHLLIEAGSPHGAYPITIERASLLLAQGKAAEAKEVALSVLRTPVTQETAIHRGMALLVAAEAMLALEDLATAQTMAQAVIAQGMQLGSPELDYRGHLILARAACQSGNLGSALTHYDAVTATLQHMTGELVYAQRSEFLQDKDALYLEALAVALEAGASLKALTYLEQGRARAAWVGATHRDEELEELRTRHRYISGSLLTMPADSPTHAGLLHELQRLERRIRDVLEAGAERVSAQALVDEERLRRLFCQLVPVVAYALLPDDVIIFVCVHGEVRAERVAGGARRVRTLSRTLRLAIDAVPQHLTGHAAQDATALRSSEASVQAALQALWAILIAPVEHLLPGDGEALTVVPHGILHAIPLLALHDGTRYLAERWTVRCVSSCLALGQRPDAALCSAGGLLALGFSDNAKLPHAAEEAREIAALMGGEALLEEEASGARLRAACRGRAFLHLSAHGALRLDAPNSSCVQLADGPFHPIDVLSLDLRGCRLVTLSACRTGLGRMSGGDEQIGLLSAFFHAGTESALATLWRVDDASTLAFMRAFYQEIAAGATPAAALRSAQLGFIRDPADQARTHPYFWAAFQLVSHVVRADDVD